VNSFTQEKSSSKLTFLSSAKNSKINVFEENYLISYPEIEINE